MPAINDNKIAAVDLDEPATFFESEESELPRGMAFDHLSQALRYAAKIPLRKQDFSAKIVTRSGAQYRWEQIDNLNDHLATNTAPPDKQPQQNAKFSYAILMAIAVAVMAVSLSIAWVILKSV